MLFRSPILISARFEKLRTLLTRVNSAPGWRCPPLPLLQTPSKKAVTSDTYRPARLLTPLRRPSESPTLARRARQRRVALSPPAPRYRFAVALSRQSLPVPAVQRSFDHSSMKIPSDSLRHCNAIAPKRLRARTRSCAVSHLAGCPRR